MITSKPASRRGSEQLVCSALWCLRASSPESLSLAGFQVITAGRFWVFTEALAFPDSASVDRHANLCLFFGDVLLVSRFQADLIETMVTVAQKNEKADQQ